MKRNVFFLSLLVVLLAMGLVLAGCGDDDEDDSSDSNYNGGTDNNGVNDNNGGNNNGGKNDDPATVIIKNANGIAVINYAWVRASDGIWFRETNRNERINPNTSRTFANISPGSYTVGVLDEFASTKEKQITLTSGQTLTVTYTGPASLLQ